MLPMIHIDQVVLQHWRKQIDYKDAALIALVETLNPDNPKVRSLMHAGYFLLNRQFALDALCLLKCGEDQLSRRIKNLEQVGIIDRMLWVGKKTGRYSLYVKLSRLYWRVRNSEHRKIDKRRAEGEKQDKELDLIVGKNVHGRSARMPTAKKSNDHLNDQKREPSPPPHTAAVGSVSQPQESSPLAARTPQEEEAVGLLISSFRSKLKQSDEKGEQKRQTPERAQS
jgi:hypothetical protein